MTLCSVMFLVRAGHPAFVRAHSAARAKPCDDKPSVRPLHQGRGHGHLLHSEVRAENHFLAGRN
jgi:hypothetical protein